MANIPTLSEGGPTEEAGPSAGMQAPPTEAYGGRTAADIQQLGVEVGKIADQERQKTIEVTALKAETDYQTLVNKLAYSQSGFSSLPPDQALERAEEFKKRLTDVREQMAAGLGSRYGSKIFLNSSLRYLRFAEDHIDSAAARARRTIDDTEFKVYLGSTASTLANMAASKEGYNQKEADGVLEDLQQKAYMRAARLGLSEDGAHDFAAKSMSVGVDALLGALSKTGHPKAREEYDRWGEFLSPTKVAAVENALTAKEAQAAAQSLVYSAPRIDLSRKGTPDHDSRIDETVITAGIEQTVKPEMRGPVSAAVNKLLAFENKRTDDAVKMHTEQIVADGTDQDPNSPTFGQFTGVDRVKSSDDIAWMIRNASTKLNRLDDVERKKDLATAKDDNEDSLIKLRANLTRMIKSDPEGLRKMGKADLLAEMMDPDKYPGFTSGGLASGQKILTDLQKHPKLQLLETVPKHVRNVLEGEILPGKGDADQRKKYEDEMINEVSEAISADALKGDDVSISQFIHRAFDKKVTVKRSYWFDTEKYLIDLRMEARKKQGGGRLGRVQVNPRTGETRMIYDTD
jgi:hypothetical protein